MKVGILSDTHGFVPPSLSELFAGVDWILHAGDIGHANVMRQLTAIAPTIAVRGNIDGEDFYDYPRIEHKTIEDIRFTITHNAGDVLHPSYDMHSRILAVPTDILISGHYHAYWCTQIDSNGRSVLWLSPGACGNAGHHQERTALILTIAPADARVGDIRKDIQLEKIHLGPREFMA